MASEQQQAQACKDILKCKDYYDILGLSKTAGVDDIKKAYRKKSIKVHPDKNKDKNAEDAFKKLSQAYVCLSDDQKRKSYDMFGNEEDFLRAQQGQGQNPFQGFNPDDLFREMFSQMHQGGGQGMPPEFAAFFGGGMPGQRSGGGPYQRRRQGNPEADLLNGLFGGRGGMGGMGGMGGPGVSFSFSSHGPGGATFYSSSGGGGMPRQRQSNRENIENLQTHGGQRRQQQQGSHQPQFQTPGGLLRDCCTGCLKNVFFIIIVLQTLSGYIPSFLFDMGTQVFTSDSNINKYSFNLEPTTTQKKSFVTPLFNEQFYVDDKTFTKLTELNQKEPSTFREFQNNMENHMFENAKKECTEAKTEKQRLIKRANQFNHRPEKQEEILNSAESIKGLQFCEKYKRYDELVTANMDK